MKSMALFIVLLALAIGTYVNELKKREAAEAQVVEDTIETKAAAPHRADIPL